MRESARVDIAFLLVAKAAVFSIQQSGEYLRNRSKKAKRPSVLGKQRKNALFAFPIEPLHKKYRVSELSPETKFEAHSQM